MGGQSGRFCQECGAALGDNPSAGPPGPQDQVSVTRKTTSVLFGDLVGFTPLAEARDVEDVRDLLSHYFQRCRTVIARYGGTVEKFIGDAVMAVWGVPTVHEDDAERAVRAALELSASVAALGKDTGLPDLQLRVGVVTGEVAVTEGATGEGMVAGDAVNTAARIQAQAPPGRVWVDKATRDRSASAVAFAEVGLRQLKGKDAAVPCWEALSVVAAVGGAHRIDGLIAPLTGRARELTVVTELFHATGESQQPRLLVVSGAAGVGKSRLGTELQYYLDGLSSPVWWHQGRCRAYGDAVAFGALTEALRTRLDLPGDAGVDTVDVQLAAALERYVPDAEQRRWLGPRLATLLGGSTSVSDLPRDDLFSAWTAFFQALSASESRRSPGQALDPVVLLIDDAHHADGGLLDFLEHAVDRGRFPLFVVILGRPELVDSRPGLATGRRRSSVHLEPLSDRQIGMLVDSLVTGLSDVARELLVRRSEGIPLFAVETVRWLIDREAVQPLEGRYVAVSPTEGMLGDARAPATVEALAAARLDGLDPAARGLLADAAVLGLEFDLDGLAALGHDPDSSTEVLATLVRRDLLRPVEDTGGRPAGSWAFSQAVVRSVAYGNLSRRDRRARHLAVAHHLGTREDPARILQPVIAQHLIDAVEAAPQPGDAAVTGRAVDLLRQGAQRAVDVGAPVEALRLLERAFTVLGDDDDRRPFLDDLAAAAQSQRGDFAAVRMSLDRAIAGHRTAGRLPAAARSACRLAWTMRHQGLSEEALRTVAPWWRSMVVEREGWLGLPSPERDDHERAWLRILDEVGAALWATPGAEQRFPDLPEPATVTVQAIGLAEQRRDLGALARGLSGLALELDRAGAVRESSRAFERAAQVAEEAGRPSDALGALSNLCAMLLPEDLNAALRAAEHGVALGDQAPIQPQYEYVQAHLGVCRWLAGDWVGVHRLLDRIEGVSALGSAAARLLDAVLAADTGHASQRRWEPVPQATDAHLQAWQVAADELGGTRPRLDKLAGALDGLRDFFGRDDELLLPLAVDAALDQKDRTVARQLLDPVAARSGELPPLLEAQLLRLRAGLALAEGADVQSAATDLDAAVAALDAYGAPFYAARARLSLAEALFRLDEPDRAEGLLLAAADTFAGLAAQPWLERVRHRSDGRSAVASP